MEFIAAKCPNCAGELRLPDDKKQIKCMYCGFDVFVREAVNAAGTNLENLTRLAYLAETDRNDKEAYEYFKKVLEIDPDNFEALVGKAIAAENSQSLNYETREYEGPPKTWPSVLRAMNELPEDNGEAAKIAVAKRISEKCFGAADEIAHRLDPKNENILVTLYERSKIMALKMDRMGSGYSEFKERYETEASNWLSKLKSLNPEAVPEAEKRVADRLEEDKKSTEISPVQEQKNGTGCLVMIVSSLSFFVILLLLLGTVYDF